MREPTIAILSDQNLFREGIVQLLKSQGFQCVSAYRSGTELLQSVEETPPRLALIDLDHSADDPFALLRELRGRAPHTMVVVVGTAQRRAAADSTADASQELPEAEAQVLRAVASLARETEESPIPLQPSSESQNQRQLWSMLTPRQRDVLSYLSTGSDNLKIAANLGISERAVKAHVSALLSLFSAENRTELAVLACRAGMRPPLRSLPRPQVLARASAS